MFRVRATLLENAIIRLKKTAMQDSYWEEVLQRLQIGSKLFLLVIRPIYWIRIIRGTTVLPLVLLARPNPWFCARVQWLPYERAVTQTFATPLFKWRGKNAIPPNHSNIRARKTVVIQIQTARFFCGSEFCTATLSLIALQTSATQIRSGPTVTDARRAKSMTCPRWT